MTYEGYELVRYADDMVILCHTREQADAALQRLDTLLIERGLRLHPVKTRVVDATQRPGFDFLGYRFFGKSRYPRPSSEKKLRGSIREKTPRTQGQSLPEIVKQVNASLRGWFEYLKHSSRSAFNAIDAYVRMRLRSILRKRSMLRRAEMKTQDFDELVDSVREAGRILRGEAKPSRELTVTPEDVTAIRNKLRKSKAVERALGRH